MAKQKVVYYKDESGEWIASGFGGNMNTATYDKDRDGIIDQANKVTNALTIVDGKNTYTYDGSEAVSLEVIGSGSSSSVFVGTQAEFDALPAEEQNDVEVFICTDDNGEVAEPVVVVDTTTFVGTQAEFDALSAERQAAVEMFVCTDEGNEGAEVVYKKDFEELEASLTASVQESLNEIQESFEQIQESLKPVSYDITLLASGWTDGVYTIQHSAITADNRVYLNPGYNITTEQLEALQGANIIEHKAQEVGKGYIKAMGEVPTVDIPVRLVI